MEDFVNIVQLVSGIVAGLAVCIPIVYNLVKYVCIAVKEKNWGEVVNVVLSLMKDAEGMFDSGVDKKEFVMSKIVVACSTINYTIDEEAIARISVMIDSICNAAKIINVDKRDIA